jgi:rubrerythrin
MTPDALILAFVVSMLAALSAVTLYSELLRKRFKPAPSEDRIFRCEKCAFVYTDDADVERSRCPQCGTLNKQIVF